MCVDTGVRAPAQAALPRVNIISYEGHTDGLRYGTVYFFGYAQGFSRTYLWDRLADVVHLENGRPAESVPDLDPDRIAAVHAALRGRP